MKRFLQEGETFTPLPSVTMLLLNLTDQIGMHNMLRFLTRTPAGHGGGIGMSFLSMSLYIIAQITFSNVLIANNAAVVGGDFFSTWIENKAVLYVVGGMSIHMTDLTWNEADKQHCFPAVLGFESCQKFDLYNSTIENIRAMVAGGVFMTIPEGVALPCGPGKPKWIAGRNESSGNLTDPLQNHCLRVHGNGNLDGSDTQAQATTNAVFLHVEGGFNRLEGLASGDILHVPCENEETGNRCPLSIMVKDVFNQTIQAGIADASFQIVFESDAIVGDLRYKAEKGVAAINNTRAWGINRTNSLTILSERDRDIKVELEISTRGCYPGEIEQGTVCTKCPVDQYGYNASLAKCESCESNADCSGGAVLIPKDGYWHSTPFSPVLRKCILSVSCSYAGRAENLTLFYEDLTDVEEGLRDLDKHVAGDGPEPDFVSTYPQCAEGYEGLLCGSCQSDYGHSFTGECDACPEEEATNGLLLFVASVWLFILSGINCAITLASMKSRVELVEHEVQASAIATSLKLRDDTFGSAESSKAAELVTNADLNSSPNSARHLIATVQWTETLKILINYLQVTSIALRLQMEWTTVLRGLLKSQAALAGLATVLITAPYECNFRRRKIPALIAALWMRLGTPWIVQTALVLACMLHWMFKAIWKRVKRADSTADDSWTRFFTHIIVISIVSVYISYIDIVREFLRAVHCVRNDAVTEHVPSDHPYRQYAIEPVTHVWAEDTDLVCFEGSHLPVGIASFIGLSLAFGGIVCIIVWRPLNEEKQTEAEFISRYWFLYQAYRKEWYRAAWESLILTRKALIAAVVVFSVHLGSRLQATLCAGILVIAQALQSFMSPFKVPEDCINVPEYAGGLFRTIRCPRLVSKWMKMNNSIDLNILEPASLVCSSMVFFSAAILHEPNSTSAGRTAMAGFAFAVNFLYSVCVLYRLYAGLHLLLDQKLEIEDPTYATDPEDDMGLISLFKKAASFLAVWNGSKIPSETDRAVHASKISLKVSESQKSNHDLVLA